MLQSRFLFNYSLAILIVFSFLYFVIPIGIQYIVGESFYIYSSYQFQVTGITLYFFGGIVLFIVFLKARVKINPCTRSIPPDKYSFKIFFYINMIYLIIIVIRGISFRIQGVTREYLLEYISAQLIPGYGYLLLLAGIAVIYLKSDKLLYYFIAICLIIDLIYQGKIFSTNAVMVTMFYLDEKKLKISFKRLLIIATCGFGFLFIIFTIRSIGNGGNALINIYSLFSEFMGVNATIGWGYDYYKSNMPMALSGFDLILQEFYIGISGHGLALSPAAYFVGNFGDGYLFMSPFYLIVLYFFYRISSMIIGRFALFVFMYDFIHLLRHGPNLFLAKSIAHLLFLIGILIFFNNYKKMVGKEKTLISD
jgi:hypothetical protein